jgi:hypothetical protein
MMKVLLAIAIMLMPGVAWAQTSGPGYQYHGGRQTFGSPGMYGDPGQQGSASSWSAVPGTSYGYNPTNSYQPGQASPDMMGPPWYPTGHGEGMSR